MRRSLSLAGGVCLAIAIAVSTLFAHAPSGAIFTTLSDGTEVNFNIYPAKEAVYLDGGPGPGAPQTAAGLDDGVYVTVQLMPYADTPNPGGEYKVWATLVGDFACDLDVQDCGVSGPNQHGFIPPSLQDRQLQGQRKHP